ncbi:hypothetical protein GGP77_000565 [Salinibacter ruber]|jgi:hypothetical protein|uniref:Uncharacterized protein n=1 Tax=Salinibacter ruber TaxID=146919 RepID=A0A9X2UQF4_9BACT|nr:hypothetical protein [Salinibacter ruber]MCS3616893.1 hypothetical protein [Salinibacter ruber]MCS3648250.1 hypothetical protein [Salinibacter ruber]MCS3666360.1 hypothetical protein [Salinibacter ruber]MCS3675976.1 hypothetical protein [Salinibacter ruber]
MVVKVVNTIATNVAPCLLDQVSSLALSNEIC